MGALCSSESKEKEFAVDSEKVRHKKKKKSLAGRAMPNKSRSSNQKKTKGRLPKPI